MGKFKSIAITLIVLCFLGVGNITALAANSNSGLDAQFSTPGWESSLKITDKYKEFYVEYSKEYKSGLGILSMEYGNCDIYSEKTPEISRTEYDTKFYYKNDFTSYSFYDDCLVTVNDKEYIEVNDGLVKKGYIYVENGIIHQFQFWTMNVSEEEIETVLKSAEYPSLSEVNTVVGADSNKEYGKASDSGSFSFGLYLPWIFAILLAIVIILFLRDAINGKGKAGKVIDAIDNVEKKMQNHRKVDSRGVLGAAIDRSQTTTIQMWKKAANPRKAHKRVRTWHSRWILEQLFSDDEFNSYFYGKVETSKIYCRNKKYGWPHFELKISGEEYKYIYKNEDRGITTHTDVSYYEADVILKLLDALLRDLRSYSCDKLKDKISNVREKIVESKERQLRTEDTDKKIRQYNGSVDRCEREIIERIEKEHTELNNLINCFKVDSDMQAQLLKNIRWIIHPTHAEEISEKMSPKWEELSKINVDDGDFELFSQDLIRLTIDYIDELFAKIWYEFMEEKIRNTSTEDLLKAWTTLYIYSRYSTKEVSAVYRVKDSISMQLCKISDAFVCSKCRKILGSDQKKFSSSFDAWCRDCVSESAPKREEPEFNYNEATNKRLIYESGKHVRGCLYTTVKVMTYKRKYFYTTNSGTDPMNAGGTHGLVPKDCIVKGCVDDEKLIRYLKDRKLID